MAFNIEQFRSQHNRNQGYLKTNRFEMVVSIPPVLRPGGSYGDGASTAAFMKYYIQDTTIPGVELMTGDVRRHSYGPNEKRPFGVNVNALQMVINNDGMGHVYEFFQQWLSSIMPHDYSNQMTGEKITGAGTTVPVYQLSYKNEYAVDGDIYAYNEKGQKVIHFKLIECFPSSVSPINVSWADQNQIQQFTIELQYLDWTKQVLQPPVNFPIPPSL